MQPYSLRPLPRVADSVLSSYPPLVRTLLLARGITSEREAELFLNPDWDRDTHDPFLMKDMEKVCERIVCSIERGETIAIWSDYDMDGIPGAVVLWDTFRMIGYDKVVHHTPHRNRDGFGLNKNGLDELKAEGVTLVITIDCGIGDVEMIEYAHSLSLDVIVTDHHIPGKSLPPAYAILNPKQDDCAYPEPMLCGAAVAFKLAQGLAAYLATHDSRAPDMIRPVQDALKWLVDMAGMSTIADMVPLTGENRALAHYGLVVLRKSRRVGLQALLKKARADQRHLTEDDIGFTIAPRVNAASRMGHAKDAFRLLATDDAEEAGALAHALDTVNTERKTLVAAMKREIHRRLEKRGDMKEVIVLGNPDWKPSLLGLVAGSLAEEYHRPVFLWGREEGVTIKGSCRGVEGVSAYEIMQHAAESFIEYGGHAQAGGFSVSEEAVHALEAALVAAHSKVARAASTIDKYVDSVLTPDEVRWDTYRAIVCLAPFGEGNHKPLFLLRDVMITTVRQFGKGSEHLEVGVTRSGGDVVKAIAFFSKSDTFHRPLIEGKPTSLVVHLEASYFRGRPELRLKLIDVV